MPMSRGSILDELSTAGREFSNAAVLFLAAVSRQVGISPVEEKTLDLLQREGPLTAGEERFAHLFAPFGRTLAGLYTEYTDEQLATILNFLEQAARLQSDAALALAEASDEAEQD